MEKYFIKNRFRYNRGPLNNFFDLPIDKREIFIKIKKFLTEYFNKDIDVYVWGSYKHGFWDELSDYDVIIYEVANGKEIDNLILEKLKIKVNVNFMRKKIGVILIP